MFANIRDLIALLKERFNLLFLSLIVFLQFDHFTLIVFIFLIIFLLPIYRDPAMLRKQYDVFNARLCKIKHNFIDLN